MKTQKKYQNILLLVLLFIAACQSRAGIMRADDDTIDRSKFKEPPAEYRVICWMHFNLSNMSEERVIASVQANVKRDSWGAFMIESSGGSTAGLSEAYLRGCKREPSDRGIQYLSEEYFKYYRMAIEEGLKNKFPLSTLFDEWRYPGGMVGGLFYAKYSELAAKSLELAENNVTGPGRRHPGAADVAGEDGSGLRWSPDIYPQGGRWSRHLLFCQLLGKTH
jgi:hypothetical protein